MSISTVPKELSLLFHHSVIFGKSQPILRKNSKKEGEKMKKLAVMVYEIQEKDIDYIPEGFPVLVWDTNENTLKLARKGVDPLPPLKSRRYKCLLYKEPPAVLKPAAV